MTRWALIADSDVQRAETHRHLLVADGLDVFVVRDGEAAKRMIACIRSSRCRRGDARRPAR